MEKKTCQKAFLNLIKFSQQNYTGFVLWNPARPKNVKVKKNFFEIANRTLAQNKQIPSFFFYITSR
jgi:hypothetical protein